MRNRGIDFEMPQTLASTVISHDYILAREIIMNIFDQSRALSIKVDTETTRDFYADVSCAS